MAKRDPLVEVMVYGASNGQTADEGDVKLSAVIYARPAKDQDDFLRFWADQENL